MKNTILFLSMFIFMYNIALSQNGYSIDPESFDESYNEDLNKVTYFRSEALMENSSDSVLNINWEIININIPVEWGISVSDKDMSYPPGPPIIGNNGNPLVFAAGETNIPFNVDIYHNQTLGCGFFEVLIILDSDGSVLDTIDYEVSINDDDCLISAVEDNYSNLKIELFPNPFVDNVMIHTESIIQHVTIYNLNGETLYNQSANAQNLQILNVSKLDSGIYFLEIVFKEGKRVVKRIIK